MKKLKWILMVFVVFALFLAGCNQSDGQEETEDTDQTEEQTEEQSDGAAEESSPENEEIVSLAETFITQLAEGNYEAATEEFDETMASQFTAADLEEVWVSLNEQIGDFIDQEYIGIEEADDFQVVLITGIFNDTDVTFQVTFDEEQQIAGFYVV